MRVCKKAYCISLATTHTPFQLSFCSHNSPWLGRKLFQGQRRTHITEATFMTRTFKGPRGHPSGMQQKLFLFLFFFGVKHCCCGFYLCIVNGFLGESVKKLITSAALNEWVSALLKSPSDCPINSMRRFYFSVSQIFFVFLSAVVWIF